jgi:hypothetical protein
MYSPTEIESKYKGAHRNELLRAIAYVISYKPIEFDENDMPIKWEQNDLSSSGYYHELKTLVDENGNKLKYKDTNEDLIPSYAKVIERNVISHSPKEVIHMLIGNKFKEKDIDTFEKLFNIILNDKKFKYHTEYMEILEQCAKSIKENERLEFPQKLSTYID